MDAAQATDLARQALVLVLLLALPVLLTGLVVSLIVSLLQAVTQVQDQTLSFVPRIFAMLAALVIAGPWMVARLVEFGKQVFGPLP